MRDLAAKARASVVFGSERELFCPRRWERLRRVCALSPRQLQVAQLICDGRNNRDIAAKLGLSVDTVRLHTKALFGRLAVDSRVGVVMALVRCDQHLERRTGRPG